MEEVMGMSDRVIVMREHRVEAVLERGSLTQEAIARFMTGAGEQQARVVA